MDGEKVEVVQLELKYCERCGGLWVRPQGSGLVYCAPCVVKVADLPKPRHYRTKPRIPIHHGMEIQATTALLYGRGGHA